MIYKWGGDFMGGNFLRGSFHWQGGGAGIFIRSNFLVGNFLVDNFLRGNFPVGNFPDILRYFYI